MASQLTISRGGIFYNLCLGSYLRYVNNSGNEYAGIIEDVQIGTMLPDTVSLMILEDTTSGPRYISIHQSVDDIVSVTECRSLISYGLAWINGPAPSQPTHNHQLTLPGWTGYLPTGSSPTTIAPVTPKGYAIAPITSMPAATGNGCVQHDPDDYCGLFEVYKYCKKCGIKLT